MESHARAVTQFLRYSQKGDYSLYRAKGSTEGRASREKHVKKDFPLQKVASLVVTAVACAACAPMGSTGYVSATDGTRSISPSYTAGNLSDQYGNDFAIRHTINAVISQGSQNRLSSRAIRLPERPLGEIAVFGYQFPENCGGHEFRVLEAQDTQILEFSYPTSDGDTRMIRDYISGPRPFVQPGLWTAYDHTADSISTMTSQIEQRGAGMFNGVYSQGLVTNLAVVEQRALGSAYRQALNDVYDCGDVQTLADASTQ